MELLDCNLSVGHPAVGAYESYGTVSELLAAVAPAGVVGGIVWHIAQRDYSADEGNCLLMEALSGWEQMFGCWTLLPPQTREVITDDFFQQMKQSRIVALRAFPDQHRFELRRSVFGDFLDELAARRVPLMLSTDGAVAWSVVYDLLEEVPDLTCILCDIGIHGQDRHTWPLLERYPKVFVETSLLSLGEGALEAMVREFGSERILFGSGFPARYAEASALQLAHADVSDADKAAIARGNLERLVAEVKL